MADGSMRLRAPWPLNEIEILCRLYNRSNIKPLLDALPWRSPKAIAPYLGAELREKIENPLRFQAPTGGAGQLPGTEVNGYDVTLLIDICKAVIRAESDGKLLSSQANIAKQAHVILGASAKAGIKGLVYALSGYDASKEEVIAAFKYYVQTEARKYEKEFPQELYDQWYRLYELPEPERGRPWLFKTLTLDHVYYPLAKSNGKILDLVRANKASGGQRSSKLFQFLNEIGARALRTQIGRLLEMSETSANRAEYEKKSGNDFTSRINSTCRFLPASRSSFLSDLRAPFGGHAFGARFPAFQSALTAKCHGRRVFAVVGLGKLDLTGRYVRDELGELVCIAGSFRFGSHAKCCHG